MRAPEVLRRARGRLGFALERRLSRRALDRALGAVAAFPSRSPKAPHGLKAPLVVSLTSYPPRFPTLALTLRSLLDQRTAADRVVLWVTPADRCALPDDVLALHDAGLEVATVGDLRSYKKLVPALQAFPGSTIVTADDDVYYPPDWLTGLTATARAHPDAVVGFRCHMARRDAAGALLPYGSWDQETSAIEPTHDGERLFPTGTGGVLYPPGSLQPQVQDERKFMTLCPSADDVWFFWMARLAGTRHRRVPGRRRFLNWPESQGVALHLGNVTGCGNDKAIRALEAELGPVP